MSAVSRAASSGRPDGARRARLLLVAALATLLVFTPVMEGLGAVGEGPSTLSIQKTADLAIAAEVALLVHAPPPDAAASPRP